MLVLIFAIVFMLFASATTFVITMWFNKWSDSELKKLLVIDAGLYAMGLFLFWILTM